MKEECQRELRFSLDGLDMDCLVFLGSLYVVRFVNDVVRHMGI